MRNVDRQRKKLVQHLVVVLLAFFGIGASPDAVACSCAAFPANPQSAVAMAYPRADVIFLGTVVDTKLRPVGLPPSRDSFFKVHAFWKGQHGAEDIVVRSAISEAACGTKFDKGKRYLIFANWDRRKKILRTNLCELNRRESEAQGLIKALHALRESQTD